MVLQNIWQSLRRLSLSQAVQRLGDEFGGHRLGMVCFTCLPKHISSPTPLRLRDLVIAQRGYLRTDPPLSTLPFHPAFPEPSPTISDDGSVGRFCERQCYDLVVPDRAVGCVGGCRPPSGKTLVLGFSRSSTFQQLLRTCFTPNS